MEPTIDMFVSPHDRAPRVHPPVQELVQIRHTARQRWVPSRFNARTVVEDGRLILWNTYSNAINVFEANIRDRVMEHLSPEGVKAPLDRVGRYLSRRGYLVAHGTDEVGMFRFRFAQDQWRTDALQLILLASEDCNFRCVYCYEKFREGTMRPEVRQGVRALVMERLPRLRELKINWFGGEPLYGWEAIEELGPFFKDVADRHGLEHKQEMTTNAYLLTEERATRLLEWGCRSYQITIDGLPEEHDCKRVGRDGSPTYHVILDNLRSMKARHTDFGIVLRVNYDRENLLRLGDLLEALSTDFTGDDRFMMRFRPVGRWGGENDGALNPCGLEEGRAAFRQLREKAAEVGLRQEGGIDALATFGNQVCYAARPYNFIVGATGKLMKCTVALDDLDENVVGQLHPDGRMDIRQDRLIRWVNPQYETDPLCPSCHVLPTCQGAMCPLTRIRDGKRTCCHVKSNLKQEMRFTLSRADRRRARIAAAVQAAAEALVPA